MSVKSRPELFQTVHGINLRISHFAKGTFPTSACQKHTLYSVNRLLLILENPNGKANYIEDSSSHLPLKEGFWYLVPAFHPALYVLDERLTFLSIHFYAGLYYGVDLLGNVTETLTGNAPDLIRRLDAAFDSPDKLPTALLIHEAIHQVLGCCLTRIRETPLSRKIDVYRKLLEYMEQHCSADLSVDDFAEVMKMSRAAFSRRFSADLEVPPKRFFNRILADKASRLLRRPDMTVKDAANLLHFSSEFAFSRFFRKQLGVSPRSFREMNFL